MPVGYAAGVAAYRAAVNELDTRQLSRHYTDGLRYFHDTFVPKLKGRLKSLSGGVWRLDEYAAYAAGSDVDFMTHLVEAVAARDQVCLFPGDWFGFKVGCTQEKNQNLRWTADSRGKLACLCIPSVRNGHFTEEMAGFLEEAESCLLNLNLFPTLEGPERQEVAARLASLLPRSVLSISFSRGFGLTASQLGVFLVHPDHPYRRRFATQWDWFTYFYNALAARAFLALDQEQCQAVDRQRHQWVMDWLSERGLPAVVSGSYYVKSFRVEGPMPLTLQPLFRDSVVRLCFKPPQT
ncbi:hypothetical protein AYO44_07460 [Planctomycetaceae bacterium SCGC AG-212-F19]|nr:hypothetical protein AYO44_07460 [Planctomycetaceae bacterium SCGC AG-212-F19]